MVPKADSMSSKTENEIVEAVFEETTGQHMPSPDEIQAAGRALQKGYGEPYAAYRIGVIEGARAAVKMMGHGA